MTGQDEKFLESLAFDPPRDLDQFWERVRQAYPDPQPSREEDTETAVLFFRARLEGAGWL